MKKMYAIRSGLIMLFLLNFCGIAVSQSKTSIKIFTFNILHGANTDGSFNLDLIAEVIQQTDADLVALQEVDRHTKRAKNYDLVTELGIRTKMAPLFGRAMYYDGGEYGEGVLSKHSIVGSRAVPLPHLPDSEPRTALEITIRLPQGDTLQFIATHLDHLDEPTDRIMQVQKIVSVFKVNSHPTILAGDLNDVPESTPITILKEIFTPAYLPESAYPTYPSDKPTIKIDYIMTLSKDPWKVVKREVVCHPLASDHCGYLVELELLNEN